MFFFLSGPYIAALAPCRQRLHSPADRQRPALDLAMPLPCRVNRPALVQAAQVPIDAIPLDAPDAPPQSATEVISTISVADLPANLAQTHQIRGLLTDL